ncbi:MAG: ABC transporter permease [Puniceicoccales bacterium]|jgi:ABC-2 type transport system permease protein|nr:ABC transporter permease [Puniceicoccales bacterium]
MKNFWTLLKYEIHKLIVSPSTYVISLVFTFSMGAIFAFVLHNYTTTDYDVPFAQMFFRCFWLPTYATIPLITMRSLSEGYKNGTMQNLFSAPISHLEVVLAEFFAAYAMFILLWLSSLVPLAAVKFISNQTFADAAFASKFNIAGGLLFVGLVGMSFTAIGILASSLTENQIISSMVTFFMLMALLLGGLLLANSPKIANLRLCSTYNEGLSFFLQLDNFCNGLVDSRVVVFHLSSCALALCLTTIAVQRKLG